VDGGDDDDDGALRGACDANECREYRGGKCVEGGGRESGTKERG
jgi:hypothetical protein